MGDGTNRIPPSAALVLVAPAAILFAARLHTYDEPLETDITGAAVIGNEILAGRALYADMWDHKPPALHLTHAAASRLGYGPRAIFLLNITTSIVTLLGAVIANETPLDQMPADEWSLIKYGPILVEERKLAREIDTLLLPGASFYEWGSEVGLYYLTQRCPPGAFSVWPVALGAASRGPFTLYVRRGGKLEARVVRSLAVK